MTLAALAGLAIAAFNYFSSGNGIHGTGGALLVVISSALLWLAALALAIWPDLPRWLRGVLLALIVLDIFGTGLAAYMLEADWLLAAMAAVLLGWIIHLVADPAPRQIPATAT
jgi:hypothetical protein